MADKYWTDGGADGVWATGANWNGGTAPGNSDVAIIGTSNRAIVGATVATTGLTVRVTEGFGGTIGADAPLIFSDTTTVLIYGGKGAYANFGGTTYTSATLNVSGGQQVVLSSGTFTTLTVSGGNVTIAAAVVVTTLNNVGGTVTAGYNATAFTTANNAGTLHTSRVCTTLNAKRGTAVQFNNGVTTFTSCGTVNIENGATYNKQSGGTDTAVNAFPGSTFTIVGNAGNSAATVTVTTLNQWAGSKIVEAVNGITLTVGTRNYIGVGTTPTGSI